jgi:alpha-1,3-glucosyltransferase
MDEHLAYTANGENSGSARRSRASQSQSQAGSVRQRTRHRPSSGLSASDIPKIVAPTPRRHFLDTSGSQLWLRTPPMSPSTSRGASPTTHQFPSYPTRLGGHRDRVQSFSSLAELKTLSTIASHGETREPHDADVGMGKRWIRWMHKQGMKQWVVPSAIIASAWIKWGIGLGSYSGRLNKLCALSVHH